MNTKVKKILIIIIIILVIALIGLLVYNFFIKKSSTEEWDWFGLFPKGGESEFESEPEQGQENGDGLTPQPELKIKPISQKPVLAPTLTTDRSNVIYYSRIDGTVWKSNFDGSGLSLVSGTVLDNLVKVIWSPDKNGTITVFEDSLGNVTKYFYNYNTSKALPLSKYINDVAWSPESNKIAYQYQNDFTDENNISTSNPDGSGYSNIIKTRIKNLAVEWPKGTEIFLREKPSGLARSSLYSLNIFTKSFNKVISDVYGFSVKWSSDENKILYSSTNPNGKNIAISTADRSGSNQKSINVSTLAEKCVWSQDPRVIFCAVPKNINEANILPDDFYKGTFAANDEFWKINIETGDKTKILQDDEMQEIYDATDLFLSPEENYLFFINKVDGLLYSIRL